MKEVYSRYPQVANYFSFAFMRNPITRAIACYDDKFSPGPYYETCKKRFYKLGDIQTFAEYVEWLCTPYADDAIADRHWCSQHEILRLPNGNMPDFIGHFENLESDWNKVLEQTGMPQVALPHLNASHDMNVGTYDARLLYERYETDFEIGGYALPIEMDVR